MKQIYTINQAHVNLANNTIQRFINRYPGLDMEQESELYDAGYNALEKAYNDYDAQRGCSFKTYATRCIWYALLDKMKTLVSYSNKFVRLDYVDNADTMLNSLSIWQAQEDNSEQDYLIDIMLKGIELLPEKDRTLLKRYYGIGTEPRTLQTLANELGVSFQAVSKRVRRIEKQLRTFILKNIE